MFVTLISWLLWFVGLYNIVLWCGVVWRVFAAVCVGLVMVVVAVV